MEIILKCFFENFEQLERNSLHARYKRRAMVDYFNTLIEGCIRGEGAETQKIVREAIISILRYHESARNKNGSVCMMGKYHNILYVAVKICYDWQLKDTGTVAALLEHIYSCEKTFERIFIGAIFGTRAPHYIAGWKSDFDDQEQNLRALVYFIDHATNAGLEFPSTNSSKLIRFIDVPIESCGKLTAAKLVLQLGLPDKLHILLRFGALVNSDGKSESMVECVLNRLNEFNHVYPYNIVTCLQILLRVIPNVTNKIYSGYNVEKEVLFEKYSDLFEDGIIPTRRSGFEPPELKHLCRYTIRKCLWENYQLPYGIRMLPIPESLRKYVDILED